MSNHSIEIHPHTLAIGADVAGVDLSQLDDALFAEIKAALHQHLVLVFHDQHLSPETQMAVAARFGEMEVHEVFTPLDGHPEVSVLEYDAERRPFNDVWHSDVTYREQPSLASLLYAHDVPTIGGDTLWRSAYAAYDALSAPLQALLENLTAEHDFLHAYGRIFRAQENSAERIRRAQIDNPPVIHPVIVLHPVTGKRLLYVNPTFTTRIRELGEAESDAILKLLFEHLQKPEFHVRVRWRQNDLVMWDNRSTQHYATSDYYPAYRRMHRITVGGDRPRSVHEKVASAAPIRAVR